MEVVKRYNRSGSYIFNGCSVQIPLLPSKKVPLYLKGILGIFVNLYLILRRGPFLKGHLGHLREHDYD